MPVKPMLGDIELQQVQKIEIEEDQVFTQHSIPALEGDFFQGLGRRSSWVKLSGVLTGADVQDGLQELRDRFRAAQPVDFVSDIATATKINKVIIEEMGVRELAGKPFRFEYAFTLREYIPAPQVVVEIPPVIIIPPPSLKAKLIVRVIVEGEPDFDFSRVTVEVNGTREEGGVPFNQSLSQRVNNTWTEEDFPPGHYTAKARVPDDLTIAPGSATAIVQRGQTTDVTILLRRGRPVNVAKKFVVHFRFDKALVEPCMRHVLKQVADYARNHPDEKLLIVGNTDESGKDKYNLSLGDRRARSVYAYLTFGRDPTARDEALAEWNILRQPADNADRQAPTVKDTWGRRQSQYMLQALGFYPGNVDGDNGPLTSGGVRDFQTSKGLPATGVVDDPTWAALIEAYLSQDPQSVAQSQFLENCPGEPLKWVSCGEQHPLSTTPAVPCPSGIAWRPNRRAELLFVVNDRLPQLEPEPVTFNLPGTPPVGSGWCVGDKAPATDTPRCTFLVEDCTTLQPNQWCVEPAEPGSITVTGSIVDENGTPLPNQKYVLMAPDGEFLSDQRDGSGGFKPGECLCGSGRGEPVGNKTRADGTFDFTGRTTPIGVYIMEVKLPPVGHPPGPYIAHAATKPPATGRGSVVCKRLDASDSRFDVIILSGTPIRVNPRIVLESAIAIVKKSYTNPARKRVLLDTDSAFLGTGTLTRSSNAIRFFTAAIDGTEITFDGTDNVFDGAQLTTGVALFAEGAIASAATDDVQLTLTLASSEVLFGSPATATMTAVELTLDICARRTAPGVDPVPLSTTDKIDPGRMLEVRSADNSHERALLIVRVANPAAFTGDLVLNPIDAKVQLFAETDEVPAVGQISLITPQTIANSTIPADGVKFWAEGVSVSTALRDTGFRLGIQGVEEEGDRVAITVSAFTLRVEGATQIPGTNTFVTTLNATALVTIIADVTPTPSPIPPDFITWSPNTTPTASPLRRTVSRAAIAVTNVTATANGITRSVTINIIQIDVTNTPTAASPTATFVRFGLWDHAFRPPGAANLIFDAEAEADNFAGADSQKFHIRIRDLAARNSGSVQIDWRTLDQGGNNLDIPTNQTITLVETPLNSGVFISRGLMLVTDGNDQSQPTHSGLPAGFFDPAHLDPAAGLIRNRNESNHRIRRGSMFGSSVADYKISGILVGTTTLPIFQRAPDERRQLPLQIFVLRVAAGGNGVIPTTAGSQLWARDLRIIRETYERIGLSVNTVVAPGTPAANIVTVGGDSIVLIDPPGGTPAFQPFAVDQAHEIRLANAASKITNTIRLFYIGRLTTGNRGESYSDSDATGALRATAFVNAAVTANGPYSPAHEVGHILVNKSALVNTGHYNQPTIPAGNRFQNNQNLMRNGTSQIEGVTESKRLYNVADADGFNQYTAIRGSIYTRP